MCYKAAAGAEQRGGSAPAQRRAALPGTAAPAERRAPPEGSPRGGLRGGAGERRRNRRKLAGKGGERRGAHGGFPREAAARCPPPGLGMNRVHVEETQSFSSRLARVGLSCLGPPCARSKAPDPKMTRERWLWNRVQGCQKRRGTSAESLLPGFQESNHLHNVFFFRLINRALGSIKGILRGKRREGRC